MGFVTNYLRNYIAAILGRQPVRPLLFSYYITHRCPLNCVYCSDGQGSPFKAKLVDELNTSQVNALFKILRQATDTLDITGGEPLLRSDLEDLLDYAHSIGFRTVLNTKGIGLQDRPELLKSTDVLVLSVDSLQSGRLAKIIGSHEDLARKILDTLEWIVENRLRIKTKIVIAAVIVPGYLEDTAEVLQYCIRNSLAFQFSPQIVGTTIHPQLLQNVQYNELIDNLIVAKTQGANILGVPRYLQGVCDLVAFTCYPLLMPTIAPDGRMYYPCLEYGQAEIDLLQNKVYQQALDEGFKRFGPVPHCGKRCHIFCHMALSLLQQYPISAIRELRNWGGNNGFKN